MIKAIIFDLDGVLLDAKEIHYEALNKALKKVDKKYIITREEHLTVYDGLSTNQKLELLSKNKNLPLNIHKQVWHDKQQFTLELFENIKYNNSLFKTIEKLSKEFKLGIATNSITKTLNVALKKLELEDYFSSFLANEDCNFPKPHSEIYQKSMINLNVSPKETLILEDSPKGRKAANDSGAYVYPINFVNDFTYDSIKKFIKNLKQPKYEWSDLKLNVLIPMAGRGSRFTEQGYIKPKPLIEIEQKSMIQLAIENLNIDANYIFLVLKEHIEKYNIDSYLKLLKPNCKIVVVDKITEGAACTVLLAKKYINNNLPLITANCDQFIEWDSSDFCYSMYSQNVDGGILTFKGNGNKWSYAKTDKYNNVLEVAEKKQISHNATVGVYFWKQGSDFVKYAEQMIQKNIRVNNEFYICPVFNEAIQDNKKIIIQQCDKMWGLGTPEDLKYYLGNYKK